MKRKAINTATVIVGGRAGGAEITLTQFSDGKIILEKNECERWFVSTEDSDGKFYLQENLIDGEIRDISVTDNLPDALYKIAWAN